MGNICCCCKKSPQPPRSTELQPLSRPTSRFNERDSNSYEPNEQIVRDRISYIQQNSRPLNQ